MDAPYDALMGFRCLEAAKGSAVYEAVADARHHNPGGVVHGGFLGSLVDAAMGAAFLSSLAAGETGVNADLQMRFLRPVTEGRLVARARTVHAGGRRYLMACDIEDGEGLVATAQSQFIRR